MPHSSVKISYMKETMDGLNKSSPSDPFYVSDYNDTESQKFDNVTRIFTPVFRDVNQQAFFLIGMSFLGGMIAGFIIHCMYTWLLRYFFDQLLEEVEGGEGHINLSYIGDDFRIPNDEPPDYATVMAATSESASNSPDNRSFFKRFFFRKYRRFENPPEEEPPPPTYSSVVASLESDLSNR